MTAGQRERDQGLPSSVQTAGCGPLLIRSSRMSYLLDALEHACRFLGLTAAAGEDEVLAGIIAPECETVTGGIPIPWA